MPMPRAPSESTNPAASAYTSLQTYEKYAPQNAYSLDQDTYFWGKNPTQGDEFAVIFNNPVALKKVKVETGHPFQKNDYLRHGVLEASPTLMATPASALGRCNCTNYVTLGNFTEGSLEVNNLKLNFPVKCLRIRITKTQEEWLIVYQIAVDIWKEGETTQ